MPGNVAKWQVYLDYTPDGSRLPIECLDSISSCLADLENSCLQLSLHMAHTRFSFVIFKRSIVPEYEVTILILSYDLLQLSGCRVCI